MGQKAIEAGPLSLRIAQIIRRRKEEVAISDYVLADMSGVPRQRLRRAMVGDRPFLVDDMEAVATALGLIPWMVMREAEESLDDQEATVIEMPTAQAVEVYDGSQPPERSAAQAGDVGAEQGTPDDLGEYSQVPPEDWD